MIEEIENKINELRSGEITYAELGEWFYFNGMHIASLLSLTKE